MKNETSKTEQRCTLHSVMPNIYNMKLHERIKIDGMRIMRVAGGWIYDEINNTQVFVPFNNEFMIK